MTENNFAKELLSIHEKLDRILDQIQMLTDKTSTRTERKSPKKKHPPLTEEEIRIKQEQFSSLYERWLSGDEYSVQEELEKQEAEELRRFADANNLNVTSKMSKQRVLHLIAVRFREKRQLHSSNRLHK